MIQIRNVDHLRCELVRNLRYDPNTGLFHWRITKQRAKTGAVAGTTNKDGYVKIRFEGTGGKAYYAQRLVWLYCHGFVPSVEIDHEDGNRSNNRLNNLRPCLDEYRGRSYNCQNQKRAHIDNVTGFLGVSPQNNKFRAQLVHEYELHYLGLFDTPEQAHAAYIDAKRLLHLFNTL